MAIDPSILAFAEICEKLAGYFNQRLVQSYVRLIHKVHQNNFAIKEVDQLEDLFQTLPLASDDFGFAVNRLGNARRYLQSAETGAARWELNTLVNQLRTQANAKTVEPRRRLRR